MELGLKQIIHKEFLILMVISYFRFWTFQLQYPPSKKKKKISISPASHPLLLSPKQVQETHEPNRY